jgi:alpha-D-ribose 1-methylphosphonate 5-triphosphate synthase subunit PhnH
MTTIAEMPAGFADKVLSAQSTFRSVMDAMARPGSVQRIEAASGVPSPMMRGSAAIALTLFDQDTPVWLDAAYELRGPGIDGVAILRASIDLPDLLDRLSLNAKLFPRGIDLVLVADDAVVAIPRTTRLTAKEG